jgi:hypothetical protein
MTLDSSELSHTLHELMPLKSVSPWSALSSLLALSSASSGPRPAPAELHLTLATLHAAGLTTPRATADTPGGTALTPAPAAPIAGVVELSGGGGTYHLQVQGQRAP